MMETMHEGRESVAPPPGQGDGLDQRMNEAAEKLDRANQEISESIEPAKVADGTETSDGVLKSMLDVLDRVVDAIGDFFGSLFGSPDAPVDTRDPKVQEVARKMDVEPETLQDLKDVRRELTDLRPRVEQLQDGTAKETVDARKPDLQEARGELANGRDLVNALTERVKHTEPAERPQPEPARPPVEGARPEAPRPQAEAPRVQAEAPRPEAPQPEPVRAETPAAPAVDLDMSAMRGPRVESVSQGAEAGRVEQPVFRPGETAQVERPVVETAPAAAAEGNGRQETAGAETQGTPGGAVDDAAMSVIRGPRA